MATATLWPDRAPRHSPIAAAEHETHTANKHDGPAADTLETYLGAWVDAPDRLQETVRENQGQACR
jgi:hypothetical protein